MLCLGVTDRQHRPVNTSSALAAPNAYKVSATEGVQGQLNYNSTHS
jgi:hypothetical protein